jgi:16S rRNA G966 N2-methylase RsmD
MKIDNYAWVLPRPSRSKYVGSFPLHFERKLLNLLEIDPTTHKILHTFGGKAEFGWRCDINPDVKPDVVCDAHYLPFHNNEFDLVILDPPYNEEFAKQLYNTGKLRFKQYTSEAVRVCKNGGFVVMYHYLATPSLKDVKLVKRILMETRPWHKARIVHIHQKGEL